jgi:hypothetical protein
LKKKIEESKVKMEKEAKIAMEKEVEKKLEEQKAMETEQKAIETEQKAMESDQNAIVIQRVPDDEFPASDIECPASPASPEYEVTEKGVRSEEKKSTESCNSLPELAVLTQKDTQPEIEAELSELELDYSSSFEESRENQREVDESFIDEDVLTIDTDEEIL